MRLQRPLCVAAATVGVAAVALLSVAGTAGAKVTRPHVVIPGACALAVPAGHSHCDLKLLANLKHRPLAAAAPAGGYGPGDLQSAYNLPSGSGGGGPAVAIVDPHDGPTAEAQPARSRPTYGAPA